jgi:hypothetical protein
MLHSLVAGGEEIAVELERLVQWGICARLPQGAGSDLRPPLSVLEGTSGYSTVYEFASTAVPESPELKEQQQHSSRNSPRMRQAMTHAPGSAGAYVRVNP